MLVRDELNQGKQLCIGSSRAFMNYFLKRWEEGNKRFELLSDDYKSTVLPLN
jgi:hypothetical protein